MVGTEDDKFGEDQSGVVAPRVVERMVRRRVLPKSVKIFCGEMIVLNRGRRRIAGLSADLLMALCVRVARFARRIGRGLGRQKISGA
jgi:hypothetical protein